MKISMIGVYEGLRDRQVDLLTLSEFIDKCLTSYTENNKHDLKVVSQQLKDYTKCSLSDLALEEIDADALHQGLYSIGSLAHKYARGAILKKGCIANAATHGLCTMANLVVEHSMKAITNKIERRETGIDRTSFLKRTSILGVMGYDVEAAASELEDCIASLRQADHLLQSEGVISKSTRYANDVVYTNFEWLLLIAASGLSESRFPSDSQILECVGLTKQFETEFGFTISRGARALISMFEDELNGEK